jgi:hypothetical protein
MALPLFPPVFVLGLPGATHPYIDPGTGSLVLQAVLIGLVAALVAVKNVLEADQSLPQQAVLRVQTP